MCSDTHLKSGNCVLLLCWLHPNQLTGCPMGRFGVLGRRMRRCWVREQGIAGAHAFVRSAVRCSSRMMAGPQNPSGRRRARDDGCSGLLLHEWTGRNCGVGIQSMAPNETPIVPSFLPNMSSRSPKQKRITFHGVCWLAFGATDWSLTPRS